MADSCYINQANSKWGNLKLGKDSTVRAAGCVVCCAAMVICKKLAISDDDEKLKVIKAVISTCTTNGNFLHTAPITYNNTTFKFSYTATKPDYNAWPIVYYTGKPHAVLATSSTSILDPGWDYTTVAQAEANFKGPKAYWTHTSSGSDNTYTCDTNSTVTIKKGNKYQARITCSQRPNVVAGSAGIVSIRLASQSGNDYFFAFTGVKAGSTGIYINGSPSAVFVCKVV